MISSATPVTVAELIGDLARIRALRMEATQHLLGDTIAFSDEDWQRPSRLPGWTRAHLATHLARNADALLDALERALSGEKASLYDDEEKRIEDIERGSERSGLDLQIDLDSSEDRLNNGFKELLSLPVEGSDAGLVALSPGRYEPVAVLPLARLSEVVRHHVDLDCGFEPSDIDADTAEMLQAWQNYSSQLHLV
jgi:maleylpyruvate isomerase